MEQSTHTLKNIIRSLDDIRILLFWKIIKDKNYFLLDKNYFDGKEYSEDEALEVKTAWFVLYDEYYRQCNDAKSKNELRLDAKELELSYRILRLTKIIELIGWVNNHKCDISDEVYMGHIMECVDLANELESKLKGKLNIFDSPVELIKKIGRFLHALQNDYKRITSTRTVRVQKTIDNIYLKVAQTGVNLGMQLNVNEMSASEWLAWQEMSNNKIKAENQKARKGKGRNKK